MPSEKIAEEKFENDLSLFKIKENNEIKQKIINENKSLISDLNLEIKKMKESIGNMPKTPEKIKRLLNT